MAAMRTPRCTPRGHLLSLAVLLSATGCKDEEPCTKEAFPRFDGGVGGAATYLPLDVLCGSDCPASEAIFRAPYTCRPLLDNAPDGADAESARGPAFGWVRAEGCGSVQWYVVEPYWPRYYHFSMDGGALIGAGRMDDVVTRVPGSACEDYAYLAGVVGPACPGASLQRCSPDAGIP